MRDENQRWVREMTAPIRASSTRTAAQAITTDVFPSAMPLSMIWRYTSGTEAPNAASTRIRLMNTVSFPRYGRAKLPTRAIVPGASR